MAFYLPVKQNRGGVRTLEPDFLPKLPMEYIVTAAGQVTEEEIRLAVMRLLNPAGHTLHIAGPGPRPYSPMSTYQVPSRTWPATFGMHQRPNAATGVRQLPPPRVWPGEPLNAFGDTIRSTHQYLPDPALGTGVQIRKVSDLGGSLQHYFVWHGNRLLTTDSLGSHPHWRTLPMSWHKPLHFGVPPMISQATLDERSAKPVWQMSETQKLTQALWRGATRVFDNISKEEVIVAAAIIIALSYVGISEVLALGLVVLGAVVGGLDFVLNVVQLAMDGYKRAITARSEQDLEAAADIFAKMFKDGGLDILSIVGGAQALKLLRGRGIFTVGEYFAYLKRELDIWRASRAAAGSVLPKPPGPTNQPQTNQPSQPSQSPPKTTNQPGQGPTPRKAGNLAGGPLKNATQGSGRFKLEGGPPNGTVYRADNQGNITSYATYDANGMILKRVDVTGAAHNGVATPHVIDYGRNTLPDGTVRVQSSGLGNPRPATPSEIP